MTITTKGRFGVTPERTVGQLVADASKDMTELIRHEVALAKAEIKADVKHGALGGGLLAAAGVLAFLGFVFLLVFVGYLLMEVAGLPGWASFLIVAGALLLVGGLLGAVGYTQVKKVRPPERTIRTSKDTIAALKASVSDRN